jgi:hypothetical protein
MARKWQWPFPQTYKTYGGYPMFAIVTVRDGVESVYRQSCRSDKAFALARSVWRNNQPLDEVWVVNQKTGSRRDIISRESEGV